MCAHPVKYCRTPAYGHQRDAVWCNKMSDSERNCTWQVGSIPASKANVEETKPSNTSELLCSSIVDPPQHATIIAKADSGASNNYWQNEDMKVLTNVKNARDGPTVQLTNNETMSATRTGNTPLSSSLSAHEKSCTSLMDYTVPRLSHWDNCVIMTMSPY